MTFSQTSLQRRGSSRKVASVHARILALPLILALIQAVGCSSNPADNPPEPGENGLQLLPPPGSDGIQFRLLYDTEAGSESQVCRFVIMPDEQDVYEIDFVEHEYKIGGHHMNMYVTDLLPESVDTNEVVPCGDIAGPLVYTSGSQTDTSNLPPGVGYRIPGGAVLQIESHFLNTTTEPALDEVRVNLMFAKTPLEQEAGSLFFYDLDIAIPPNADYTAKMRCQIPEDITITTMVPHAHIRAVGMEVWVTDQGVPRDQVGTSSTSSTAGGYELVLDSRGYNDLEPRRLDPAVEVKAGQWIDFDCHYRNDDDFGVVEGLSRDLNEMCLFIASYYPRFSLDAELCVLEGSGAVHPPGGSLTCGQVLGCVMTAPDGDASYEGSRCWIDACEESQAAVQALQNCLYLNCQGCIDTDCDLCAALSCGDEFGTCQVSGC